jgi:hypothetical protein
MYCNRQVYRLFDHSVYKQPNVLDVTDFIEVILFIIYGIRLSIYSLSGPGELSRYNDMLQTGRSDDRIPVGAGFSNVQTDSRAHPTSCTMGNGSFPRVKR